MVMEDELIAYYFGLNKRITRLKKRLKKINLEFYQQTMCSYCTSNADKVYIQSFRVADEVIEKADAEAMAKGRLDLMRFQQKHFVNYMKQLPQAERSFLRRKYKWHETCMNERVERECFEEIQEIEEAAGYRFMATMPEVVADVPVTSESFTSHFDEMLRLLGV